MRSEVNQERIHHVPSFERVPCARLAYDKAQLIMFKIVTFNIWGTFGPTPEERWSYASECLAKLEADIICLQEATDIKLLERLAGITQKKLIHADCDQTGLAVLSNLPFLDFGLVPYDTKSPIEDYIRKFIWVQLKHQDREFLLTNTHLSWKANDDGTYTITNMIWNVDTNQWDITGWVRYRGMTEIERGPSEDEPDEEEEDEDLDQMDDPDAEEEEVDDEHED